MSILIINTKAGRQGTEDQDKTKMVGQEKTTQLFAADPVQLGQSFLRGQVT